MKINNISIKSLIVGIGAFLFLPACNDDILEERPMDFLSPNNAYNSVEGIKQGINGLHHNFRNAWFWGENENNQDVITIFRGLGTDVAFHGEDPNSTRFLCNYVNYLKPALEDVRQYWLRSYEIIQRANVLIEAVDAADPAIWKSEAEKNVYTAEAMFFRANSYRLLVSFFGDVPLVKEAIKSAKADFARDPKSETFKLMEEDLKFAAANLPVPGQEDAPGRITQGAAWHLLAEVYLEQGKFQDAVNAAAKVISGYNYGLMRNRFGSTKDVFGSGDVFLDLFAYGNQNLTENREAIWTVQFEPLVIGGGAFRGVRAWGPAYFRLGNTPDGKPAFRGELVGGRYTGYSDTLGRGVSWIRPTNYAAYDIWAGNWDNDYRNARHMIKRDFYYDSPESAYHLKKIDFSQYPASAGRDAIRDTCQYIYPFFLKFADPTSIYADAATSGNGSVYKDIYAMRLGETYLLRAEAYIGLGNLQAAADDINQVRMRSNAKPVSAADVNIDYLLDERARELYGEECRHYVLRRTGKLVERVRKYNNNPRNPGLNIQDYHVLWPIPQSMIDLNVDGPIQQNPGYQ